MSEMNPEEARVRARIKRLAIVTAALVLVGIASVWFSSWRIYQLSQEHHQLESRINEQTEQLEQLEAKAVSDAQRIADLHEAITYFQRAAELIAEGNSDRLSDALKNLAQAKARSPKDPYITQMVGYVYFLNKQYSESISYLEEALSYKPDFIKARYDLARAACRAKRFDVAQSHLSKAVSADAAYKDLARTDRHLTESCPQLVKGL